MNPKWEDFKRSFENARRIYVAEMKLTAVRARMILGNWRMARLQKRISKIARNGAK